MSEPSPEEVRTGLALGLLGVVIFGLTLPATRIAVEEIDPVAVTLGRALLAAACATLALIAAGRRPPPRADWPRLGAFALVVIAGFPLLMAIAMRHAPAAHGGIVLGVLPLLTAMASVVVAGERPSLGFWLTGIAGTLAVVAYALLSADGSAELHRADLLLAGAAICAATGYALGGSLSRRLGGWEVISWALVASAPFMAVVLLLTPGTMNWQASWSALAAFAYLGIFSQFLGFFAWNKGLAIGGIAKVGQTQLLQTFVTLGGAALLLDEPIGHLEIGFALLVVAIVAAGVRMRVARRD